MEGQARSVGTAASVHPLGCTPVPPASQMELLDPQDRKTARPHPTPSAPLPHGPCSPSALEGLLCPLAPGSGEPKAVTGPLLMERAWRAGTVCPLGPARSGNRKSVRRGGFICAQREEAGGWPWSEGRDRTGQESIGGMAALHVWAVFSSKPPSVGKHEDETCGF